MLYFDPSCRASKGRGTRRSLPGLLCRICLHYSSLENQWGGRVSMSLKECTGAVPLLRWCVNCDGRY